jgi:type IV fimbrial biogenesis protein FimT
MPRSDSRLPPRCADVRRRAAGFTLLELMMVLVLAAILLGVGGPSFQDSLQRNRQQSTFNRVASAMSLARSEAVIRSQPVSVCPTTDNASCGGSNWETGWLIFVDNGEGTGGAALDGTLNGTEELLRIGEPAPAGVTIRTLGFLAGTSNVVFLDSGRPISGSGAGASAGTFVVCDARGDVDAAALVVQVSGQMRRAVDSDASGVVNDHTASGGADVVCP